MHHISKTYLIFFSVACIPLYLHSAESMVPTYNNHYNPQVAVHPQIEVHPHITIANSSAFSIKIGDITMQCIQKIKTAATPDNYHLIKNCIAQALWDYRYYIACGTLVGSYSITSGLLITDYYYHLQNNTLWARWKPEYTFETFCTLPQKELTHDLLCAINERYYNTNHPTDFAHPLITFIATINTEIKICKRYISVAKTIRKMHMIKIFPTNHTKVEEVGKLLERALFIKHLFLSWLAEYNIASNQKT